jgi:uncharacterized protein DUF6624
VKKIFISLLFLGLVVKVGVSQNLEIIRDKLETIVVENIKIRQSVMPIIKAYGFESPEMDSIRNVINKFDSTSLSFVTSTIDTYGWLGKSKIGEMANQGIFITIQHADLSTMEVYFPLLEISAKSGESPLSDMAKMKDRILVDRGKKQIYGTQSILVDGKLELRPIEDKKNVNKRRRKVGLKRIKVN